MTRERYKTPEEDVSAEFSRVCQLFQQALPGPSDRILFDCLMNEASSQGLNWVDALQYVVAERSRLESVGHGAGTAAESKTGDREAQAGERKTAGRESA